MHKELDHINNERHIDRGNSLFVIKQRIFVTYHPRVLPILPNCTHRYASRSIPLERSYRGRNSSTPTLQLGYEWGFPPSAEMHGGATIRWGARVELMAISWLGFEICNRRMWLRESKKLFVRCRRWCDHSDPMMLQVVSKIGMMSRTQFSRHIILYHSSRLFHISHLTLEL